MHKIDTSVPNSARIWNFWLGGKDNYEVDQLAGDAYEQTAPGIRDMARTSREYLVRSVGYLAGEGVRQFLDIGAGLPAADNTHQVAERIAPEATVIYVDNDPLVLAHARALLYSGPEGTTAYVEADVRDPEGILEAAGKILDFTQPVALMLMGVLGHVLDYDEARSIVRQLLAPLPSGSYLAHYDGISADAALRQAQDAYDETGAVPYVLRSPKEIAGFYEGLEVLKPGIVSCPLWRPDPNAAQERAAVYGGVALKR